MIEIVVGGALLAGGAALARTVTTVPQAHFGIVDWLGRRSKGYRTEGLQLVLPFSEVTHYSFKLQPKPVEVAIFVRRPDGGAKIEVKLKGLMEWRADPSIQYGFDHLGNRQICESGKEGLVLFVEMAEETIISGIAAAIRSNLGTVAEQRSSDEFVDAKDVIEAMINAILRLGYDELPHLPHDGARCSLYKCPAPCEFRGDIADPFEVYVARKNQIREVLHNEKNTASRSEIELRYGIDVENFSLDPVDFSEAAKRAFEQIIAAESDAKAAEARAETTFELIDRFKGRGLDPEPATNAAQVALGQATKTVHSIEGLKTLIDVKLGGK